MAENIEEIRAQQKEALITVHDYIEKLFAAIPKCAEELMNGRLPDTTEYLKAILNGVNFVTEVFNRTMDYVNETEKNVDKDELNALVFDFMA